MNKWWEPEIGETVWFEDDMSFIENIISGKVIGFEIVDQFNGYKMFSVETNDGEIHNLFPTAFVREKIELVKNRLQLLMNERNDIDREISHLEAQLSE